MNPLSQEQIVNELQEMTRQDRLVCCAIGILTSLKNAGYITGGKMDATAKGIQLSRAIQDSNEFTADEINAASLLVMHETGGIAIE